jgi:phage gp29-like protein
LGLLAKAAPWVIYKRNTTADWAQFSEIFGMPIREYTYEADDDKARARIEEDAMNQGSLAVFIHGKDTTLNLMESEGKTGSADLYEGLVKRCNEEISKLILGNTLTTESSTNGTQTLGTIHNKVEERVARADRMYVLDVLNYDMTDIFAAMGINTAGGEFVFPEPKEVDLASKMNILTQLSTSYNLPISDDYLYETFGIDKPKDYDKLKEQGATAKNTVAQQPTPSKEQLLDEPPQPAKPVVEPAKKASTGSATTRDKKTLSGLLRRFFGVASQDGAALNW